MMMRALLDAEREQAASAVAAWLIKHAVEATAQHPTGTNFVPVAIDPEAHIIWAIVEQPTTTTSVAEGVHQRAFEEIPMLAVAS
jgi:hypothetical protein